MKRLICLALALTMLLCVCPTSRAAGSEAENAAQRLYELGLFRGTGTNPDGTPIFSLERTPTRNEAVTMLVRLLGKENEAITGKWTTPFTDLTDWAKPYVGYAYANKLTNGTGRTIYSGGTAVSAAQYITFVLRALGYSSDTDFKWYQSWELSDKLGITDGRYNADTYEFTRGDAAIISAAALDAKLKGQNRTLLQALEASGAVTRTTGR
ncbi:MAG: hypothetical protein E7474_00330 [Ruminococcaceae bacterium]|nr:hypothetical protein [Oscillospiraceae bacterium]